RNGNLCDGRLAGGGKDFDTIHGAIGYEKMFVGGVVDDMTMVRLTKRIVGSGNRVGPRISGARKRGTHGALNGESKAGRMRKCAAGALHGDCKTSGSRICGGAEDNGSARARGNAERTLGVRSDADRKSAKHHLDCAGKAIH